MKSVKRIGFLVMAILLLTACGGGATEGLTASMSGSETGATEQSAGNDVIAATATQCSGQWDAESNMLRVSFQLETDEDIFGTGGEELRLFGGGTALMGHASAEPNGNYRFRCEGEAEMTAVPLGFDKVMRPVWLAALSVPQLQVELPSGTTKSLENVPLRGMLAPSAADIPEMIGAAYDLNPDDVSYQSFWGTQKALYLNYPDSAFVQEVAQKNGLSAENAARLGQLYVEQDVDRQHALLIDMLTSPEDEEYAELVMGTTLKTLRAMGLDFQTISNVLDEETDGRVAIQFNADAESAAAADLDVQITNRDGADNVVFTASSSANSSSEEGGESPSGGEGGGTEGGGTEGGGTEGGGTDGGGTDGGGTDGGGGGGGCDGFWCNLADIIWGVLKGAAGGAGLGGIAGSPFGPAGASIGGAIGAIAGGIAGGIEAGRGVYDPAPNDPNSPCKSPIAFC